MDNEMTFDHVLQQLNKDMSHISIDLNAGVQVADIISKLFIQRNHLQMTREQMSSKTGIKVSRIRKIETVQVIPTLSEVVRMATVLGMKLVLANTSERDMSNG